MSPAVKRFLRASSTPLAIVLSLAVAGVLTRLVNRYESRRYDAPATECSRALAETFDSTSATTADSLLLERLLAKRDHCMADAAYVDQARRLMVITRRANDARTLLERADREHAFAPDELAAQNAAVDLGEARLLANDGDSSRASALHRRAVATAQRLRERWPEWSLPYRLLDEANEVADMMREGASPASVPMEYFALERAAQSRILTGASIRAFGDTEVTAFTFVVAALGMLGLMAGVSGILARREMTRMTTSSIATAPSGYVELNGTLHLPGNADAVIGPSTKSPGVWYELETNSGVKGTRTWRERSAQPFVVRDSTGEALIEPNGIMVTTRHSVTTFTSASGLSSKRRVSERMLKEGDEAYVLGELTITPDSSSSGARRMRVAEDGRKLLVSNLGEAELMTRERIWLWCGAMLFALCTALLLWSWYQRYRVIAAPGGLI